MRTHSRTRARDAVHALVPVLALVVATMTVVGCEKRTASKGEKQAAANEERQTSAGAEPQATGNVGQQTPGGAEGQVATGVEGQTAGGGGEATTGSGGQPPPASPGTQPPVGAEKPVSTTPPAGAERPPGTGGAPTSTGSAGGSQAPGTAQPPAGSGQQLPGGAEASPDAPAKEDAVAENAGRFKYVGVAACSMCHKGAAKGSIYEVWLASPHAKAYEKLGPEDQKNGVCLACHTTGYGKALAAGVTPEKMLNVQCEACHGPGSEYKVLSVMKNRPAALDKGLVLPTKELCLGCHAGRFPQGHPTVAFNYESALLKIEHHSKPTEPGK